MNIDHYYGFEGEFQKTHEAHFRWVRLWFWWREMEAKGEGQIDWTQMDLQVDWATKRGLKVFGSFASFPSWANGVPKDCQMWVTFNCSLPPKNPIYFSNFVNKVVSRYKDKIHYWGMGNEPNHGAFWNLLPNQTEQQSRTQYILEILINGAKAAREVDPTAKIVGPDLSNLSKLNPNGWLLDILSNASEAIDVIAHHDYSRNADLVISRTTVDIRNVILKSGHGNEKKPFWLTEIGFDSKNNTNAQWQSDSYEQVLKSITKFPWWRGVFIYRIADQPDNAQSYGLVGPERAATGAPPSPPFVPWDEHISFKALQKFMLSAP